MPKKIGIVTSHPNVFKNYFPTLAEPTLVPSELSFTPDDQLVINELRIHGFDVVPVIWGVDATLLRDHDLLIVRSPWDYMDTPANCTAFMTWLSAVEKSGVKILNTPALMHWLLDKHYLLDLNDQGIDIVPTQYLKSGTVFNLAKHFHAHRAFVMKPCISAAGLGLYYIKSLVDAKLYQKEITQRLSTCDYMLQAFVPEIRTKGEWSLVFLGGKYSHGLHKKPAKNSIFVHAERGGSLNLDVVPPQPVLDFATQAYSRIKPAFEKATGHICHEKDILYMRLDIIDTLYGPVLMECEGVEPELFFRASPESVAQFCKSVILAIQT